MSQRLENRYELLDELPHVTGGRLFRARDLAFNEMVGIKQLGPDGGLDPEALQNLENTIRHLQCLPHPHLSRVYSFVARTGLLVQEWVQGISLLDLLRRRRELGMGEALHLLASLPATLDFLAREAIPVPRPLLGKLFVEFPEGIDADSLMGMPLEGWPAFCLKLNPLSLRGFLTEAATSGGDTETVVVDPRRPSEIQEGYGPRELALLLYELLGGRIREVDNRRYSPLSSLREAGNAVLRRELIAMPHADCESLWKDLLEAQTDAGRLPPPAKETAPATRKYHIPGIFLPSVHPGTVLNLEPESLQAPPMHFVTGPRFTIGRSVAAADFVARILPENETNDARTNRLSRVHTLLEITDGQVTLRDGNGSNPSLNGSSLDQQALHPNRPTELPQRGRLALGGEYTLDLIALSATENWEIDNADAWSGPAATPALAPWSAIVCQPADGHGATRHGVWLFSEIGFGLDATGHVVWDTRGRGRSPAAFHYHRGCFWLRNDSLPEPVQVGNDAALGRGKILPLAPGQSLRIGSHVFAVDIA